MIAMKDGRTGLTGSPHWVVAARFRGSSERSKNYIGGQIGAAITLLNAWRAESAPAEASDVKLKFLEALARNDTEASVRVVHEFEALMLRQSAVSRTNQSVPAE
jgi:hypothetical protein